MTLPMFHRRAPSGLDPSGGFDGVTVYLQRRELRMTGSHPTTASLDSGENSTAMPSRCLRVLAAVVVSGSLVLAGCGGSSSVSTQTPAGTGAAGEPAASAGASSPGATAAPDSAVAITMDPRPGARHVRPDATVTVTANGVPLSDVTVVDERGRYVSGAFDATRATWRSSDPLRINSTYEVRVRSRETHVGPPVTATATFRTAKVPVSDKLEIVSVQPADGAKVGVGHPLVVGFDRPVPNRAAVQAALNVVSDPPVRGAWYWIDDEYVHYRPASFWPSVARVTLQTKLAGVKVGPDGLVGGADRRVSFDTARRQVLTVNVKKHRMQVVREGKVVRTFEITAGKKGWETRNGIKVVMGKDRGKDWTNEEIGAQEEYSYHSEYAMRMTNSGEFIHDAPWNKGNIGEANTSHGCVGLYPKDMKWLFENTLVGDPIIVRGSPRPYHDLSNRYADWNIPWAKWQVGNARDT